MNELDNNLKVPYLPNDIPFNAEQTQWLGGFLAGLHTRLLIKEENVIQSQGPQVTVRQLTIIYGSQTGNAEGVAEEAAEQAKNHGLTPTVIDMDEVDLTDLAKTERLLVITSTYGEGEMPDNAQMLWDAICADDAPSFSQTFYSVLALGDTNYDEFCLAGILWDDRLAELGGQRIAQRVDCDVDFDAPATEWLAEALPTIAQKGSEASANNTVAETKPKKVKSKYSRQNPLSAELVTKTLLNKPGSSKEIYHYEFCLADSGESYEAGDALNVIALNRPELVTDIITQLQARPEQYETVNCQAAALVDILTQSLEIRIPSKDFLSELAIRSADTHLMQLMEDTNALNDFLWGKDTLDLLRTYPEAQFSAAEFINLCKPLAPRAYSISSSINYHTEQVHLTIGNVRYHSEDREHHGVCSTYLADIANLGDKVLCYFSPNKHFSVPEDPAAPMIMIGPGTGIAPFRAFLEERSATQATGDNWLFFGDRNGATDFIYQEEIEKMQSTGLLTRLDVAFSRDQVEKIYVQDRMLENGQQLFAWLERGGYLFICGDAYRMAKDVDKVLHTIVQTQGDMSADDAEDYINELKKQKRYVRDVY